MGLKDTFVKTVKPKGTKTGEKYSDGYGLSLHVRSTGKYWRFSYRFSGKQKLLAFGVYPAVSLAKARQRRDKAREQLADGIDPSVAKREEKQSQIDAAKNTFEHVAYAWLLKTAATRKEVTQARTSRLLERDVFPFIGKMPISIIKPRDLLDKVLRKIETRGTVDTAHRAKQVCGQIFRFAVAIGLAERDITVDLRGALSAIPESHFAAITEPKEAAELIRSIRGYSGHHCTVAALKLLPLVFVRPGELRTAEWAEIDLDLAEWRIPASKMKMKVDHLVPLSTQAIEILRNLSEITGHGRFIFPSMRTGERPMSENTINAALRALGFSQEMHSAHGFRAMARTIMDEVLGERVDFIEHQLAHAVKDPNGRAYNRTAHLPARKLMMQRWADYLDKICIGGKVIKFRSIA